MNDTVRWLVFCPARDLNWKAASKRATAAELRAALQHPDTCFSVRNKIRQRLRALQRSDRVLAEKGGK